ncbi:MAG: S41 family peptidase [Bacillota bacterium]
MLKNIFKLLIFSLLLFIFFVPIIVKANYINELPPPVVAEIKSNRNFDVEVKEEVVNSFKNKLYSFNNFDEEIPIKKINIELGESPRLIPQKEALKDIDFLFKLFKYGYAGYEYFGGEKRFSKSENKMIKEIKEKSFLSRILVSRFEKIIIDNLQFIQDGHFAIAGQSIFNKYYYFTSPRFDFSKDEDGYYTYFEQEKLYLKKINDEDDISKYLKMSLNKKGEIVYRLGFISKKNRSNIHLKGLFVKKDKQKIENIVLLKRNDSLNRRKTQYNFKKVSGINVIEHTSANASQENIEKLETFAEEAKKFKDDNYFIIDLRGNSGGNSWYAREWIKNYTGIIPETEFIEASLATKTSNQLFKNSLKKYYGTEDPENHPIYSQILEIDEDGWAELDYSSPKEIKNQNLILVLIDAGVASAGESYISYLRQLENVIFIGINTRGLVNTGNLGYCQLPNSKIDIFIPKDFSLEPNFVLREGKGFYPDFWVKSEDALDRAVLFLKRYYSLEGNNNEN